MENSSFSLQGRRILLVISGGIAAYKSLDLIRRLKERGATVRCILTKGGAEFVTPLSVSSLSGEKVYDDLFSLTDEHEMGHIRLTRTADLAVVAPASANLIARLAQGRADDLASTTLLASDKPILVVPAMNAKMWQSEAVQANIAVLAARGTMLVRPGTGEMACGEVGEGRMAEVAEIVADIEKYFAQPGPLSGRRALVTSGPTHEPLDPVRFIGNRSSGKQGHAIAAALAREGAAVTLVTGPVALPDPAGIRTIHVQTAREMLEACEAALPADIAVCAAAVADWRPAEESAQKLKKGAAEPALRLVENPDILAMIAREGNIRPRLVVGFAAETEKADENARRKLAGKNCDWIVVNDVSGGAVFDADENKVTLLARDSAGKVVTESWDAMPKDDVARLLAARVSDHFKAA
ncbi:MAG: bifunctional phosphopantothenoylcysteine decarboxylase/phosphopantothenate--cysteine ligase CoaBC [Alphaproteobacteria bacterium]|nr:bifunctional phosphopantothenoylcysteine decarboxylase/phosphopantothenate--cysteine ligase CoaBC [Alphaproteobacteria bacterium]